MAIRRPRPQTTANDDAALLLAQIADDSGDLRPGRLHSQLGVALVVSARKSGGAAVTSGRWIAGVVVDAAPHIPVRDLATLHLHFPGLQGEELAEALVRAASLATSAVGVAGGALTAAKWAVPVTLLTVPIQLAVETAAVAAIEIKLVAELHEVYGVAVRGTAAQRGAAYALAWANRRGINPLDPSSMSAALGAVARNRVQRRLVARAGRGIGTLAPMFAGAAYGAISNRKQTRALSDALRGDLRRNRPLSGGIASLAVGKLVGRLPGSLPGSLPGLLPDETPTMPRRRLWARSSEPSER